MNRAIHLEHRASSRLSKHEGESSLGLCDRLDRTRDNSQRQLPTDHDYAVPTREYQTDQSSLKPAQAAARSVLGKGKNNDNNKNNPTESAGVDRVTPYQAKALIELLRSLLVFGTGAINQLLGQCDRCQFTTHYFLDERMTAKALKRDRDLYEKSASFDKCRPQWLLTEMYSARPNRALS